MIQLSVLDRMNEQLNNITTTQVPSKIDELRNAIGMEFSDNHSPTYRSELLSVSECGNICTVRSVAAYGKTGNVISNQPSYLTWNALFY
jgi:hypothetical protein